MVYKNEVNEQQFKTTIKNILGEYYSAQLNEVLNVDGLDVLNNLFRYCQKNNHRITIKSESKLPLSCPGNTSSPYFLQYMEFNDFLRYYRPVGCGWTTKKYTKWINDLHPHMSYRMQYTKDEDAFVEEIITYYKTFRTLDDNRKKIVSDECRYFYKQFKKN
jgi:hypothetical protein